jgi:hypothetical protein
MAKRKQKRGPKPTPEPGNARGLKATARMEVAHKNRGRLIRERNELIGVLACFWDAHISNPSGVLGTLDRKVICIHSPADVLCWPISAAEADEQFKDLPRVEAIHWDRSNSAERSKRLAELRTTLTKDRGAVYATPPPEPSQNEKPTPAVEAPAARRPGEFHRPRAKGTR